MPQGHLLFRLIALLLLLLQGACLTPIHPRSANIVEPSEFAWDVHLPISTIAWGELEGVLEEPSGEQRSLEMEGFSGHLFDPNTAGMLIFLWSYYSLRLGVWPGCELGGSLGIFRVGGEMRCRVLPRSSKLPFALAASVGAAWQPLFGRDGAWLRGGFDLSQQRRGQIWMLNLYLTHGPEGHRFQPYDAPEGLLEEIGPEPHDGESLPYIQLTRQESRLALALGWGFQADPEAPIYFNFGVVPYFVLQGGEAKQQGCGGCRPFETEHFEEDFGLSLTFGLSGQP